MALLPVASIQESGLALLRQHDAYSSWRPVPYRPRGAMSD